MAKEKRSFFERLTGAASIDEFPDSFDEDEITRTPVGGEKHISVTPSERANGEEQGDWVEDDEGEQLNVDVYQTADHIILKTIVAGVKPDHLDVSITRDMVTIKGTQEEQKEVSEDDYFYKELYWGTFSRTVLLPHQIEVDGAEASEKHGVLIIKLPKIDKDRETRLKVKAN